MGWSPFWFGTKWCMRMQRHKFNLLISTIPRNASASQEGMHATLRLGISAFLTVSYVDSCVIRRFFNWQTIPRGKFQNQLYWLERMWKTNGKIPVYGAKTGFLFTSLLFIPIRWKWAKQKSHSLMAWGVRDPSSHRQQSCTVSSQLKMHKEKKCTQNACSIPWGWKHHILVTWTKIRSQCAFS